ncbi:hypothetical protein BDW02DRAFT_28189 [Decorospora gaudefroyi]|uniref:Uncharacterized protein n=1 Tax=Decorospora gaudefroyi TaxID=184978 RepID=A0A6A5K2L7_9PLEO|nr:hypothetical protein BDW02DRAFT_28189 [Decorospora gaudefroyi]
MLAYPNMALVKIISKPQPSSRSLFCASLQSPSIGRRCDNCSAWQNHETTCKSWHINSRVHICATRYPHKEDSLLLHPRSQNDVIIWPEQGNGVVRGPLGSHAETRAHERDIGYHPLTSSPPWSLVQPPPIVQTDSPSLSCPTTCFRNPRILATRHLQSYSPFPSLW